MEKVVKTVLSVLFLLCLLDMPYSFYELVRFSALAGFVYLAVIAHREGREKELFIFIGLAILFQPLIKIALGRILWNIVDVITAAWLLYSTYINPKQKS
jgi:hypothetical protein